MQVVYMVAGVSGSGKSWVCRQLTDKFHYIPHDRCWVHPGQNGWDPSQAWAADMGDASKWEPGVVSNHVEVLHAAVKIATKPVITESPFMERLLRQDLESLGIKVIPYFVIESPETVRRRYEARERKPLSKAVYTRARTIVDRAIEWQAPMGSSTQILEMLKALPL